MNQGFKFKLALKANGISHDVASEKLGMSRQNLNLYFNRELLPSKFLEKVEKILEIPALNIINNIEAKAVIVPFINRFNQELYINSVLSKKNGNISFDNSSIAIPYVEDAFNIIVLEVDDDSMDDNSSNSILYGDRLILRKVDDKIFNSTLKYKTEFFSIALNSGKFINRQILDFNVSKHVIKTHCWNLSYPDTQINLNEIASFFIVEDILRRMKPIFKK